MYVVDKIGASPPCSADLAVETARRQRRTALLLAFAMAAPAGPSAALPALKEGCRWEKIPELSDDFDGTQLDLRKWQIGVKNWPGRSPGYFYSPNVLVEDGHLILRATRAPSGDRMPRTDIPALYRVAGITSKAPVNPAAYYEVRMRASTTPFTSSFWMQGKYSEIDVVENVGHALLGKDKSRTMISNVHYFPNGWGDDRGVHKEHKLTQSVTSMLVFGVWWQNSKVANFYYADHLVHKVRFRGPFDESMQLFLDTEPVKTLGYPSAEALSPGPHSSPDMVVDYVRSYKLIGSSCQ